MNTKMSLAAVIIAGILCLLSLMFLLSFTPTAEGQVLGHGWDGSNYYLVIATECGKGCVEGVPFKVSQEDYQTYQTGDFYGGEK